MLINGEKIIVSASQFYGKQNLTDDQRKAKSDLARAMHQEIVIDEQTGLERRKFGGPQPRSGRPRKPRWTEVVYEEAATEGKAYFDRLDDIAKNHPNANTSIGAIRQILEITDKEEKRQEQEQQRLERLQRDELIYLALDLLEKTGIIGESEIIDGEIEGEENGRYPELGQSSTGITED